MVERVTIPYRLEAPAAKAGEVEVFRAPNGKMFTLEQLEIRFPAGTAGDLRVQILYGQLRMIPYEGSYSGDGTKFVERVQVRYWSGDPIRVWYQNVHATDTKFCDISFEGVIE